MKRSLVDLSKVVADGLRAGFLTYEQVNDAIPEDVKKPNDLESILGQIEGSGILIIDQEDAEERGVQSLTLRSKSKVVDDEEADEEIAAIGPLEKIDDPVRMYLTQMGEIPLLTRDQEIDPREADRDHQEAVPARCWSRGRTQTPQSRSSTPRGGRSPAISPSTAP